MVYRLPENGGVLLKHVGVNKELYCYVCQLCICWFCICIIPITCIFYLWNLTVYSSNKANPKPHKLCQPTAALLYVRVCYAHGKGKGKVAPVHDMKAYRWSRCGVAHIITLAVKGTEQLTSHLGQFTPRKVPWYPLNIQQNSFNLLSYNLKIWIIWHLRSVVPRPEVLLFTRQKLLGDMSINTSRSVCRSTVRVFHHPFSHTF